MSTIVMTGATSGLGEVAAERLIAAPGIRLIVGARRPGPAGSELLDLDLSRLADVRAFAAAVRSRLGSTPVDALVLNAGLSFTDAAHRTPDGFETTFAVNHLAHFLLLGLLMPQLSEGARVVVTTSGTHDPAEKAPVPSPRHADAHLLAHPERDPELHAKARDAGAHAYTASKLCSIMTVRGLNARAGSRSPSLTAIGYDPGATPGTGLSRNYSPVMRAAWSLLGGPLGRLIPMTNSRAAAGAGLADVALGIAAPPPGGYYARTTRRGLAWDQPSELARDDAACRALWTASTDLVGLTSEAPASGG